MMSKINKVFNDFEDRLAKRLSTGIPTTEDSVRYTFFYSLVTEGKYRLIDIILEKPFEDPKFKRDRLDLYIIPKNKNNALAFEIKYHSHKDSTVAFTSEAGALFWDFVKLRKEIKRKNISAYFIYILDKPMKKYLTNSKRPKKLNQLFNLPQGKILSITEADFKKFRKSSLEWLKNEDKNKDENYDYIKNLHCRIKSVFHSDLPKEHYLCIYKIEK